MLKKIQRELRAFADPVRARHAVRFFKTGKGEYGEGDKFIGVTVPQIHLIAKRHSNLLFADLVELLHATIHEERLLALIILIDQFKRADEKVRTNMYKLYISSAKYINNWDLIDVSAPKIVGVYLSTRSREPLRELAKSTNIWQRRVAILATFYFITKGECAEALEIAELLVHDEHDLIQKAVGWMLREVGKRCSVDALEAFLKEHGSTMPRTMLRYAIEKFPEKKRLMYLRTSHLERK